MQAAKEAERDDEPDILFTGKYEPETVVVEQQVLRDGRLVVVVRRKRKTDVPPQR